MNRRWPLIGLRGGDARENAICVCVRCSDIQIAVALLRIHGVARRRSSGIHITEDQQDRAAVFAVRGIGVRGRAMYRVIMCACRVMLELMQPVVFLVVHVEFRAVEQVYVTAGIAVTVNEDRVDLRRAQQQSGDDQRGQGGA